MGEYWEALTELITFEKVVLIGAFVCLDSFFGTQEGDFRLEIKSICAREDKS